MLRIRASTRGASGNLTGEIARAYSSICATQPLEFRRPAFKWLTLA
ncbi:unnamed protein product [Laminaria digitata]